MLSPLYGQLSPLRVPTKAVRKISDDADANAYLLAVEQYDGQELELGVIAALESFVVGCKSDGIWSAIKASCILVGARTLDGALVPLVGVAPTNNNFVSADYNRETGLIGNGSTKFLNTNRIDNSDPQDNHHFSVFVETLPTGGGTYGGTISGQTNINTGTTSTNGRCRSITSLSLGGFTKAFKGIARDSSLIIRGRANNQNYSNTNITSTLPVNANKFIFARAAGDIKCNGRISFYSIGESLDLAKLDTRVSTLMTALAAAIP